MSSPIRKRFTKNCAGSRKLKDLFSSGAISVNDTAANVKGQYSVFDGYSDKAFGSRFLEHRKEEQAGMFVLFHLF